MHMEVISKVASYANEIRFEYLGLDYSPIKGPEGNIEYLLYLRKASPLISNVNIRGMDNEISKSIVYKAHELL